MNRRFFIGTTAAGIAAARRATAASDRVRVAIIGVGGRGRGLLRQVSRVRGAEVAYICDADQASIERAQAVLQENNSPQSKATNDMRRVFDDKEVDAVVISTPDHWHAPATILACDAGKDVYVEKPCAHNIREGRLMIDAARRGKRIVQVGTQSRSRPSTVRAIEHVKSGKIGRVLMAKAWNIQLRDNIGYKEDSPVPAGVDYDTWLGPAPWIPFNENHFHYKWHWHWHFGTGDAGNDGAHQLDIARWALGVSFPKTISGMGRKIYFDDDQQTPDTMNVIFDYEDKTMIWEMRIWNSYSMKGVSNGVAVYGTEGMVHIGSWNGVWGFKVFDGAGKEIQHVKEAGDDTQHMENFLDCLRTRKLPNADIGVGHISGLHCHLANIVARTGRTAHFDAETETIVDDRQANLYVSRRYRTHWATPAGA